MRRALLALAFVASVGCAGAPSRASAPASPVPASSSATPQATQIGVSDMMGAFPPTTFFVVRPGREVAAVALLNHATKYTIPILGEAQVATSPAFGRLYVLDQADTGSRLRSFDIADGRERASRALAGALPASTSTGHSTVAVDRGSDRLYTLLRYGATLRVEGFEGATLSPTRQLVDDLPCADRLVAAAARIAIACFDDGTLTLFEGSARTSLTTGEPLVSVAISRAGTLLAGAADGRIFRVLPGGTSLERIDAIRDRGTRLITDGIAQSECCVVVGLLGRVANPQIASIPGFTLVLFPENAPPSGGVLFEPPFVYYTVGKEARHVDVGQGFGEVMATFAEPVVPGALADR